MVSKRTWLLAALMVLACFGVALAQPAEGTSIAGTVTDAQKGVLPGVTITALNIASGVESVATTDEKGTYAFQGLSRGNYRVTARLAGFSDQGKSVTLAQGVPQTIDFVMALGGLSEEITVTAAKGDRAAAEVNQIVTVVSAEAIESRRPQGVEEAFERAPNVRTIDTNPYRARPQFRGFSNARVLLIVDGERLNNGRYDVESSGITPSTIDVTQIQSIEVVGGAASSLYGSDAVAGTINIITKTADRPSAGRTLNVLANVDFNGNSNFTRGNLAAIFANTKFAFRAAVSGFNQPDYTGGNDAIPKEDVVRLGQFLADGGALVNRAVAQTYAVYQLPASSQIINGGANGWTYNLDGSYFPSEKHMFRVRWMQNRFKNLGLPFSQTPYDLFYRFSDFADFDKFNARYEARELWKWFPRLAITAYNQALSRPQHDISSTIISGSSYVGNTLTGNLSQFYKSSDSYTLNDITSAGFDAQANLQPLKNLQYTTGLAYSHDSSKDTFNRTTWNQAGVVQVSQQDVKTTPDTTYGNLGWYNQLEWVPWKLLKLSGGFRVDNWQTEAKPSPGFPAGSEFAILLSSLPQLMANPGSIALSGIEGIGQVAAGQGSLTTNVTTPTGNAGFTFLLPGGINPYFRYATSFREPEITVRYLVRDFGSPVISIESLPNTTVEPERGKNIDTGVKLDRDRFRLQAGYFHNQLSNAVSTVYSPNYCIPVDASKGILLTPFPPCLLTGQHSVQFFQRVNVPGDVIVQGFETSGEVALPVGSKGSLNPFLSLGYQKGRMTNPNASQIALMNAFYNRSDTPIELTGTPDDAPYGSMPSWMGTFALKFTDARNKWWAEYELRWASQITRVDADQLFSQNVVQYGTLASLSGYTKSAIRAGYDLGPKLPVKLTLGLDNLTNTTIFLPFQNGPSPGFSMILGLTTNLNMKF